MLNVRRIVRVREMLKLLQISSFGLACALALFSLAWLPIQAVAADRLDSSRPVICIDPGHPSEVSDGFQPQNGTNETHECWVMALRVRKLLEQSGCKVVMTKGRETQKVTNVRRAEVANRNHARLMLRLHCDTGVGTGFRVFYPDTEARDGKVVGPSKEVQIASRSAAEAVRQGLALRLEDSMKDNGIASDRSTRVGNKMGGALIGSIHSKVPVVLVEMVFLNNPEDAAFIKSPEGREKMAQGLAEGARRFVKVESENETTARRR